MRIAIMVRTVAANTITHAVTAFTVKTGGQWHVAKRVIRPIKNKLKPPVNMVQR